MSFQRKFVILSGVVFIILVGGIILFSHYRPEGFSHNPFNQTINIAAAADLRYALDEMLPMFNREHSEIRVLATYGSSGNFYTQLTQSAPFDLYLSADISYPQKLSEQGFAVPGSLFRYAVGRIVVWTLRENNIPVEQLGIKSLLESSVQKIAIANPRHAPYGAAAEAAMKTLGVYESVKDKLVYGENVSQAAQFIQSGGAQIGIIALSLALAPNLQSKGRYWEVPLASYPRLEQGGVILKWAKDPATACLWIDFMLHGGGRAVLQKYGFTFPED